jgi:aminoglycoside phosphotransferase
LESSPDAHPAVVDALAAFLRRFHTIPVSECPFDSDHAFRLALHAGVSMRAWSRSMISTKSEKD